MPLAAGAVFAGYTVLRLIGSGGMGEVYLAEHPRLPRRDALKVLPPSLTADEEFRQRFTREADLAATLFHPNIVELHDRGEFDGQLWMSMDYIDGTDSANLLRERYPEGIPVDQALAIALAVADALDHAHERGLLHRDVKPANILLTETDTGGQRRIFLADFGIARPLADPSGLTATNLTVGTVSYAAPEQLMGGQLDPHADQYALAATVFHLMTGVPPYQNSDPVAVISQCLNTPPPKISSRRPELARLDDVFSTALAKDPTDRFSTCHAFASALADRARADPGLATRTAFGSPAVVDTQMADITERVAPQNDRRAPKDRRNRARRTKVTVAAATAAALLAAGVAGYVITQRGTDAPSSTADSPSSVGSPWLEGEAQVLNGTYRLAFDYTAQTINGAASPKTGQPQDRFWAFRSHCGFVGCVATGVGLHPDNPKTMRMPPVTSTLSFVEGRWREQPQPEQSNLQHCLTAGGDVGPGSNTVAVSWSMQPEGDALRGVLKTTVLTNECGGQGQVLELPFAAKRIGDVPAGATIADPATIDPSTVAPSTAVDGPGPALDGVYRVDYDNKNRTLNDVAGSDIPNRSRWWAFRSACSETKCVAVGSDLVEHNHQQTTGIAVVLTYIDGRWQDTPYLQPPTKCANSADYDVNTLSMSLVPIQDDPGNLSGVQIATVLTDQCELQGNVYKTPISAERIGEVPPSVVTADPAMFLTQ